jgi:hypothetical protein
MARKYLEVLRSGEVSDSGAIAVTEKAIQDRTDELAGIKNRFGVTEKDWPPLEQRLVSPDMARIYTVEFRQFSHDIHGTLPGMERLLDRTSRTVRISLKADEELLESILKQTFVRLLALAGACHTRFGLFSVEQLDQFDTMAEEYLVGDSEAP